MLLLRRSAMLRQHARRSAPLVAAAARPLCTMPTTELVRNEEMPGRLTKIVATIGPASEEAEPLQECVAAGMNVMRVNFSHATLDEFMLRLTNLRASEGGRTVAVMLDTKGPEIRMGGLKVCKETGNRKAKMTLVAGEALELTSDAAFDGASDEKTLYIDYPKLPEVVKVGDKVLLDDGLVTLRVTDVPAGGGVVRTEVLNSSEIGERKGVNLPGVATGLPAMSDKDKADIKLGVEHDIDMVAASFVRSADGVHEIRQYLRECVEGLAPAGPGEAMPGHFEPGHTGYRATADAPPPPLPLIISKIESTEALDQLPEIIDASDGIMVARGDLGVEVPLESVATWQKEMVEMCIAAGKPVIVATQMLETMQKNPRPTRAEVSDVTTAVLDGADAVMLSGESANGQYPVESVATQAAIARHAEEWLLSRGTGAERFEPLLEEYSDTAEDGIGAAAAYLADRVGANAIVVLDESDGLVTRSVAKCKPSVAIAAVSSCLKTCRQLNLVRAVEPIYVEPTGAEVDGDLSVLDDVLAASDRFSEGDLVVVVDPSMAIQLSHL